MNAEFEPSSSHVKVNEVMNVTPNASVSASPYPHKHALCMCSVFGFFYFRGHFVTQSCFSSLVGVGRAGYDNVRAFLLLFVTAHVSLLWQEISWVVLTDDSYFYFLIFPVFCSVFLPIFALKRFKHHQIQRKAENWPRAPALWCLLRNESTAASLQKEYLKSKGGWSRLAKKKKKSVCLPSSFVSKGGVCILIFM